MKENDWSELPNGQKLIKVGQSGLTYAIIKYHGGFHKFRELLFQRQLIEKAGTWENLEFTLERAKQVIEEQGWSRLPGSNKIAKIGSTAKENYRQDSDIDLLVITNKKISTKEAEKEADALCAIKISTFQMTWNDFQREIKLKEDAVVQSALQTGYPLINHIYYYEVLNERI